MHKRRLKGVGVTVKQALFERMALVASTAINVRDLAIKFTFYVHYFGLHKWTRGRSILPLMVCIAPDIAQESRLQRVARARLTSLPVMVLWTTVAVASSLSHGQEAGIK